MAVSGSGKLEKMRIKSYSDSRYEQFVEEFQVMFNPEQLTLNYEIETDDSQGAGTSATEATYLKSKPQEWSIDFLIDGTGVTTGTPLDVEEQINKFLEITYLFHGDTHRPRYLKIAWGPFIKRCTLQSANVNYTLFDNEGTPLRAIISGSFKEFIEEELRVAIEDASSPDLTHIRTVQKGDTLHLMCYKIYGDSSYYIQVADVNELTNFRTLKPGTELFFPPLTR